jgi:hypothetical protein
VNGVRIFTPALDTLPPTSFIRAHIMKTDWKKSFVEEFAGHPVRVALNLFIVGSVGVLLGHYAFGVEPSAALVVGAMIPALGAIITADQMKEPRKDRR